jgi:hypothetical protein
MKASREPPRPTSPIDIAVAAPVRSQSEATEGGNKMTGPAFTLTPADITAIQHFHTHADEISEFNEWRTNFRYIHGILAEQKKNVTAHDFQQFGVSLHNDDAIERFVFTLETFSVLRLTIRALVAASNALGFPDYPARTPETFLDNLTAVYTGQTTGSHNISLQVDQIYWWIVPHLTDHQEYLTELAAREHAAFHDSNPHDTGPQDWAAAEYMAVFPKPLRHSLGAFYTPLWLAEHTIQLAGISTAALQQGSRVFDPTCGSGVFFVAVARLLWHDVRTHKLSGEDAATLLLRCVAGLDLSAVAVTGARCNVVLAMATLLASNTTPTPSLPPTTTPVPSSGYFPHIRQGNSLVDETMPTFDYVVGNPPWLNWEYIPSQYRHDTTHLWRDVGLFTTTGRDRAWAKEDISGLFLYRAAARYSHNNTTVAMVVPQTLLQSKLNAQQFRQFTLGDGTPLRVDQVHDFVAVKPFPGTSNRTAVIALTVGSPTTYPVPYTLWSLQPQKKTQFNDSWVDAKRALHQEHLSARPATAEQNSSWLIGPHTSFAAIDKITGPNFYRARTGVFTGGANAVYHVNVEDRLPNGLVRISNNQTRAKRTAPQVRMTIEPNFIYSLLTGSDITRWNATPSRHILCPHTATTRMRPVPEDTLARDFPHTLAYFETFTTTLHERQGFAQWEKPFLNDGFYAIQRVGDYTFKPYKLVWKYISRSFTCAVIGPATDNKPVLPNDKVMFIGTDTEQEAHYLAGVLNSDIARWFVESRMVSTQIAPHVIADLHLTAFNPTNTLHQDIAAYSYDRHKGQPESPHHLNSLVARLFKLSDTEQQSCTDALNRRPAAPAQR